VDQRPRGTTAHFVAPIALAALLLTPACGSSPVAVEDLSLVATLVDSTTPALGVARTFAVPDTIVTLDGFGSINHSLDHAVVASVRSHFRDAGWIEHRDSVGVLPDVVILIAASTHTETGVSYTGWYGAYGSMPYWGGGVDPAWAFGAPVGAVAFTYDVGTLVLTMVDLRAPRATTKRVPLLWVAAMNGVLNGNPELPRVLKGIDQAFVQSPYLRIR
jgi:hypothetical protein